MKPIQYTPREKSKSLAMVLLRTIAVFVLLACSNSTTFGQSERDTVTIKLNEKLPKDPKLATILSAVLPGAGQVYNEKVWKLPIIYGGFATNLYFIEFNNRRYQLFREELRFFDQNGQSESFPNLNRDALVRNVDFWRRNRDLNFIVFAAIYVLNIVDAQVDAHLSGFDVSDDISMKFEPSYQTLFAGRNVVGLSLKLNF
ncbi:DUF5683 domain-containing protein [Belliella pelovolcani]|uniref:DUF5683 domain-containing protein n=1 Tax=Belliella pelovolcani TaxID=529505 RepID=UPI00391B50D2